MEKCKKCSNLKCIDAWTELAVLQGGITQKTEIELIKIYKMECLICKNITLTIDTEEI